MTTLHFNLNDNDLVKAVVRKAYPNYTGRKISVVWGVKNMNLAGYWEDGNCTRYTLLNLANMEAKLIPTAHPFFEKSNYDKYSNITLPEGVIVVAYVTNGRSGHNVVIYTSANAPVLESGQDVSEEIAMLLIVTVSRKSSYAGISDYRAYELKERFGWSQSKVNALRDEAIAKGFMAKNKSITIQGKNLVNSHPKRHHI